jgi:hypothetical protein
VRFASASSISRISRAAASSSTGCSSVPELVTQVRVERPKVDQAALHCRERPAPLGPDATYQDLFSLVGEAIDWGGDCESKLATVVAIVAPPPAPVQPAPPARTTAAMAWVRPRAPP